MNKKKTLTISILPIMWTVYVLFELITGRITTFQSLAFNVFLILLFAIVGFIIFKLSDKYSSGFSPKGLTMLFIIFMLLDQGIKIIIKLFFFKEYIAILPDMLYFSPIINTDGSWLNARFGTAVSFPFLISINTIALFLFFEIYRYYLNHNKHDFNVDLCFIFVFSGALCSLIDKIFYGGSLDFIGISDLFIADIKDLYINLGILFFIITLFNNGYLTSQEDTTFKDDLQSIKTFLIFIKNDIKTLFKMS